MPRTPKGQTRQRIFSFVRRRLLAGDPPSLQEIRAQVGLRAVETVRFHLRVLVREGKLLKEPGRARGYRLPIPTSRRISRRTPSPNDRQGSSGRGVSAGFPSVPLLGEVAAGGFELAVEDPEGRVPVDLPRGRDISEFFALRVRGESMTGAGIFPGDTVIVERNRRPLSGQIVVALMEEEATVKRLWLEGDAIELRPENPAFPVLRPSPEECRILGRVVELRRRFS